MIGVRPARLDELSALSELCLRSKAVHGYDDATIAAFRDELTLTADDLAADTVLVAERGGRALGVVQVSTGEAGCFLEKLFVDPEVAGRGVGRLLLDEALAAAREAGIGEIVIESDPSSVGFYRRMGAVRRGFVPSGSIPGRQLPRLVMAL